MTGRVAIYGSALGTVAGITDGATAQVGGFGSAWQPVALVVAHQANELGNLVYRKTARNFGPIIPAASTTIVQPVGVLVRDLFGIDFGTLTALVEVPLVDGTQRAIP